MMERLIDELEVIDELAEVFRTYSTKQLIQYAEKLRCEMALSASIQGDLTEEEYRYFSRRTQALDLAITDKMFDMQLEAGGMIDWDA